MCADIHYGQEQVAPLKGPNTDERDQSSPNQSHPACNTRPVHTEVPKAAVSTCSRRVAYSITSSAKTSSVGGIVRPSAFAVFALITNSNLIGCSTGRSDGLAPLMILST